MYIINGVLHTITAAAAQARGVIMEAFNEDEEEEEETCGSPTAVRHFTSFPSVRVLLACVRCEVFAGLCR